MAGIDAKEIKRIGKALESEPGWKLDWKSNRVLLAYPPDGRSAPIRIVTAQNKSATAAYQALRNWGIDLEPSRGAGKPRRMSRTTPTPPASAPVNAPVVVPLRPKAPPVIPAAAVATAEKTGEWVMTDHALERAEERHINVKEIWAVIARPDLVRTQPDGSEIHEAGDVAVVLDPGTRTIITVVNRGDTRLAVNGGPGRAVSKFVKVADCRAKLAPVPTPPAKPEEVKESVNARPYASVHTIRGVTARIKATSSRGGTKFGTWTPPRPMPDPSPHQPPLPMAVMTPAISAWLSEVVLKALRAAPGRWASILHSPDAITARSMGQVIENHVPELEIAVRDTAIWARWTRV